MATFQEITDKINNLANKFYVFYQLNNNNALIKSILTDFKNILINSTPEKSFVSLYNVSTEALSVLRVDDTLIATQNGQFIFNGQPAYADNSILYLLKDQPKEFETVVSLNNGIYKLIQTGDNETPFILKDINNEFAKQTLVFDTSSNKQYVYSKDISDNINYYSIFEFIPSI